MNKDTKKKRKNESIFLQCQCDKTCKNIPLPNSPFCEKHIDKCPIISPLSGYEPDYNPDSYNKYPGYKESLNCFAYAFDYRKLPKNKDCNEESCPVPFPQPGRASGYPKWSKVKGKRCPDLLARLFGDVPDLKVTSFNNQCPKKYSKIALVVDEDQDYHFYRQDSNGYWSHKPGGTNVTHLDATGRTIYNPELASRHYQNSGLDYSNFCGYLCAPKSTKLYFKRGGYLTKKYIKSKKRYTVKRK